jgi:hypothetical protein
MNRLTESVYAFSVAAGFGCEAATASFGAARGVWKARTPALVATMPEAV